MRLFAAIVAAFAASAMAADDMEVAKSALRDGLFDVARSHAAKVDSDEAVLVTVESYAKEARWADAIKALDSRKDAKGDAFTYWRALALERLGDLDGASALLEPAAFATPVYDSLAVMLKADIIRRRGTDPAALLRLAEDPLFKKDDLEAAMNLAWARESTGDRAGAEAIWKDVVASTNAPDSAIASAAAALGDAQSLKKASDAVEDPALKRAVSLRLGSALLKDEATFAEGEATIRRIAKDFPDADGAKEAFVTLADALLGKERFSDAVEAYKVALEAWPDAAGDQAVHEGLGWALRRSGKTEEALDAYARAVDASTNDGDRARSLMERGDVFSESGRGAEAMEVYRTVLSKYPDTPSGRRLKTIVEWSDMESEGLALFRDFRFADAAKTFEKLASLDPERAERMAYFNVLCLYGQGDDAEAERRAAELAESCRDPAIRAEAVLWLAKFSYNARRWAKSRELFADYATNLAPASVQAPAALVWAARAAFATRDYNQAVSLVSALSTLYPASRERTAGLLVQGEALIELARLDEAIVVLGKVAAAEDSAPADRRRANTLKSDALFVMGADNSARYAEALDGYRALLQGERLSHDEKLSISFKIGGTLEKMGRTDEAIDQYYSEVVCAYRDGRKGGTVYSEESMAVFARAAFRLADICEKSGRRSMASRVLKLVETADVPGAAREAAQRRERLKKKGRLL